MAPQEFARPDRPRPRGGVDVKANDTNARHKTASVDNADRYSLSSTRGSHTTGGGYTDSNRDRGRDRRDERDYRGGRGSYGYYEDQARGRHGHASTYSSRRGNRNDGESRQRSRSPWRPNRQQRSRSPYRAPTNVSRSPTRSRSPYRHTKHRSRSREQSPDTRGGKRSRLDDQYTSKNADPRRSKTYFEREVAITDTPAYTSPHIKMPGQHVRGQNSMDTRQNKHQDPESTREANGVSNGRKNGSDTIVSQREKSVGEQVHMAADDQVDEVNEPALSEAEIIEQRRKRRAETKARVLQEEAARKAKEEAEKKKLDDAYDGGGEQSASAGGNPPTSQPLTSKPLPNQTVQAIKDEQNASGSPTLSPNSSRDPASLSPAAMPSSPIKDSRMTSPAPIVLRDGAELTNQHRVVEDNEKDEGPSAADYDPNKDMEEDQRRQSKAEPGNSAEQTGPEKEVDMFAEDDEDDMFAPGFAIGKTTTTSKPVDASMVEDYPDGHYRVVLGEVLDYRYTVKQQIGKGTFATVVRAEDIKTKKSVAIKIACNNDTMYKAGQKEINMLMALNSEDPDDKRHIIRLDHEFMHKKHLCLVFESLGADLREVLKKYGRNRGINLSAIRTYAQQMFIALGHLKKCNILHADLKPDNMLISESLSVLKICDFGTAAKIDDFLEITPYLVSRFYRAPEVILGIQLDYAIDMWSVGCTLFELYTGRILFAGADNNQMLRAIQECRGKIPIRLLKRGQMTDRHFDINAEFVSYDRDATGKQLVKLLSMKHTLPGKDLKARLDSHMQHMSPAEQKEHMAFVDLMEKCLQLDPARRITPGDALRHEFVAGPAAIKPAVHVGRGAN